MTTSADLGLPFLASQQATPEITHNEALYMLQALLLGVITLTDTPPGSPVAGDAYICGTSPTGAWAGKANKVAIYTSGGWRFVPGFDSSGADIPIGTRHQGLKVYRRDVRADWVWDNTGWVEHAITVGSA